MRSMIEISHDNTMCYATILLWHRQILKNKKKKNKMKWKQEIYVCIDVPFVNEPAEFPIDW